MATISMQGISEYIRQLETLSAATKSLCEGVVYAGAAVMADEIRQGIRSLDTVSDKEALAAYAKREPVKISYSQRQGLLDSLGVAKIQNKYGLYSSKIGFDGYNDVKTQRWPNGQPNQLIARACESGSSAMHKQPFVRPAISRAKSRAEESMVRKADEILMRAAGG